MRFLRNTAATLALTGAGVASAAPTGADPSITAIDAAQPVPARRRASLNRASQEATTNATPTVHARRAFAQARPTHIEVRNTTVSGNSPGVSDLQASIDATLQALSEAQKAAIARALQAGHTVRVGEYWVKRVEDPSKYTSRWYNNAFLLALVIIGGAFAVVCMAGCVKVCICPPLARGDATRKDGRRARAASLQRDVELADRGRSQEPALEGPSAAHINAANQGSMHLPYASKLDRAWFGSFKSNTPNMRYSTGTAAALTLASIGVVCAAPLQASGTSIKPSTNPDLVVARRRVSLGAKPTEQVAVLNNKIEVKRSTTAGLKASATITKAAIAAKVDKFSEPDKAIIARKLEAGESVNIGSIGVPCSCCNNDNYVIKKRDEPQQRKKPTIWDDPTQGGIIVGIIVVAGVITITYAGGCLAESLSRRRRARARKDSEIQQQASALSSDPDIEMADRGRRQSLNLEQPRAAHVHSLVSVPATDIVHESPMHNPYSGRWPRLWYGTKSTK